MSRYTLTVACPTRRGIVAALATLDELLDDPEALLVVIAYLDVRNIVENIDEGTRVPVVRVRRIEPLGSLDEVPKSVRDAMAKAEEARTGRKAIPFEIVEVGEHAFGDTLDES